MRWRSKSLSITVHLKYRGGIENIKNSFIRKSQMITKNALSRMIYLQDPMNTCCLVNEEMENEYDMEAVDIIRMLEKGVSFRNAFFSSFSYFFNYRDTFEAEALFFLIQAEYYNFVSMHQPSAAIFPHSKDFRPDFSATSVSSACDVKLVALSESIQTGACKSMWPARAVAPHRYAPPPRC